MSNVSAANNTSIYVSTHGNNNWNGFNTSHVGGINGPKATIANATATVNNGGTVHIAQGTYIENPVNIYKNITIIGENKINTIINGNNTNGMFYIESGLHVTISNLSLINGLVSFDGGEGAAIRNDGTLTVKNCIFTNNSAGDGGAICNDQIGDNLTVTNSNFIDNYAHWGGAIANYGNLNLKSSTFTDNSAVSHGGAILNYNSCILNVSNTIFNGNSATTAGAIDNSGNLTLTNSNFTNNTASNYGGAIDNIGILNVTDNTFNRNSASYGGAIANDGDSGGPGIVYMIFNRIVGNTATTGKAIYNSVGIINAKYNWWGTNNDPERMGMIKSTSGMVTYNPWLILTMSANKIKIADKNGKSTIIANLNQDSNHHAAGGTVPVGTPINFFINPSSKGTLAPSSGITNSKGNGSTTFKAGSKSGIVAVNVTVDGVTVHKNITLVNYPPIMNFIGNRTVNENQLLYFKVLGSDPNGDKLTYTASGLPAGASFNKYTDIFSWTPTYSQSGVYYVTFKVSDGNLSNPETIKITIKNVDTFENNIRISNKGSGKIFYDYILNISGTYGKVTKKIISGYLYANTSRNIICGMYKANTKISIAEYIYNKANVRKNIDVSNQIIIANKVIFQQIIKKPMVTPSPNNILYPVKF